MEQLIEEIDNSGEGEVYFSDFVQSLASIPQVLYKREDVLAAFKVLAGPHAPKGLIQVKALEDALIKFGPGMSAAAAQEITSRAEVDMNGMVHYEEFVNLMMADQKHAHHTVGWCCVLVRVRVRLFVFIWQCLYSTRADLPLNLATSLSLCISLSLLLPLTPTPQKKV